MNEAIDILNTLSEDEYHRLRLLIEKSNNYYRINNNFYDMIKNCITRMKVFILIACLI